MVPGLVQVAGKVGGPSTISGGASYNNYYKMQGSQKGSPENYNIAVNSVTKAAKQLGLPLNEWLKPTLELLARESDFNPNAKNPKSSARGLFQFLDATRKNYGWKGVDWNNPDHQALAGLRYIKQTYGTPTKALQFWDKQKAKGNAWY